MKTQLNLNLITVASLSIALACATMLPAQAGAFRRSIWTVDAQNNPVTRIGLIDFSWNDADVVNGRIRGYDKLTSFSYTDQLGFTYDKAFALSPQTITKAFDFNVITNQFSANASKYDPSTPTQNYGFSATSDMNATLLPASDFRPTYEIVANLASSSSSVTGITQPFSGISPQSTPEPNSIFALLGIVGLGGISLLKRNLS